MQLSQIGASIHIFLHYFVIIITTNLILWGGRWQLLSHFSSVLLSATLGCHCIPQLYLYAHKLYDPRPASRVHILISYIRCLINGALTT